jgi:hypothetical protein
MPPQPNIALAIFRAKEWLSYSYLPPEHVEMASGLLALADQRTELLVALPALVDWAREHTSPRDPNSPHHLLVAACPAIANAEGQRMPE